MKKNRRELRYTRRTQEPTVKWSGNFVKEKTGPRNLFIQEMSKNNREKGFGKSESKVTLYILRLC